MTEQEFGWSVLLIYATIMSWVWGLGVTCLVTLMGALLLILAYDYARGIEYALDYYDAKQEAERLASK